MPKLLSSRLQSRLAHRRAVLSNAEGRRGELKLIRPGLQIMEALGVPGATEAVNRLYAQLRQVRLDIKALSADQQLDKQLLRLTYEHENASFDLSSAHLSPDQKVIVLDIESWKKL